MYGRDRNERSLGRPETRSNRSSQSRYTSDDRTYSMNDRNYDPIYNQRGQRGDIGRDERDDFEREGLTASSGYDRAEPFAESRGYRGYEDYPGSRQGAREFDSYGGGYMGRPGLMGFNSNMRASSPSSQSYRPYQDYGSGRNEHWGELGPRSRGFMGKGPKGYKRSDERIHDEVCELLTCHYDIDASEIEVEVKEGVVTLSGTVDGRRTKRLAEDVVADMIGVKDVRNQIRVLAHDSSLLDGSGERSATYRSASNSTDSSLSSSSGARASKNASSSTSATRQ